MVLFLTLIEDEIGAELVDGVIGEMHPHVLLIAAIRFLIGAGGQSTESLVIHIDL